MSLLLQGCFFPPLEPLLTVQGCVRAAMALVSAGQDAESAASCSFLAHSTQHLVSPSKGELMGQVHSSIIVWHVWDVEGSPPFLLLPNGPEIKGRSEQKSQPSTPHKTLKSYVNP